MYAECLYDSIDYGGLCMSNFNWIVFKCGALFGQYW